MPNKITKARTPGFYFYFLLLPDDFFLPPFFEADFFLGTFAPLLRASESPIAIACFRLFTVFPLRPLFSLPRFFSCMALLTFFLAPLEYFVLTKFYLYSFI